MRKCAFCGKEKKLTREHVWPNCFLKRVGKGYAHHSIKSGNVHGGDYIVRDVCSNCNNLYLSPLDLYFCSLYDKYFAVPLGANKEIIFEFDYDLLLRSLLKIAFNTARSAGCEVEPFQRLIKYILIGGDRLPGVALIAEIVSPTYIEDSSGSKTKIKEIRPKMYRSALGQLDTKNGNAVLYRIVNVNSFFLHLLLIRKTADINSFEMAKSEFLSSAKGTVLLKPEIDNVLLRSSPQDSLSSMLPKIIANFDQYKIFFEKMKEEEEKNR